MNLLDDVPISLKRPRESSFEPTESRARTGSIHEFPATESRASSSNATPLVQQWMRAGTTGRGIDILTREDPVGEAISLENDVEERLSFFAQGRLRLPMTKKFETKNSNKEQRGKTLNYEKEPKEVRAKD